MSSKNRKKAKKAQKSIIFVHFCSKKWKKVSFFDQKLNLCKIKNLTNLVSLKFKNILYQKTPFFEHFWSFLVIFLTFLLVF